MLLWIKLNTYNTNASGSLCKGYHSEYSDPDRFPIGFLTFKFWEHNVLSISAYSTTNLLLTCCGCVIVWFMFILLVAFPYLYWTDSPPWSWDLIWSDQFLYYWLLIKTVLSLSTKERWHCCLFSHRDNPMLNTTYRYRGLAKQQQMFFLTAAAYPSMDTQKVWSIS